MAKVTTEVAKSLLPPESILRFTGGNTADINYTGASYIVNLDGSPSNDPDGVIVSYQWQRKKDSEDWEIQKSTTISNFTQKLKLEGTFKYRLKCIDGDGLETISNELTVNFTKTAPSTPTAFINGSSSNVAENTVQGQTLVLDGSGSIAGNSSDRIVAYSWEIVSSTDTNFQISGTGSQIASFTSQIDNVVVIDLEVTNEGNLIDTNRITITVTENYQ